MSTSTRMADGSNMTFGSWGSMTVNSHIINGGLAWSWGDFEIAACYGLVIMCGENQTFDDMDNIGNLELK